MCVCVYVCVVSKRPDISESGSRVNCGFPPTAFYSVFPSRPDSMAPTGELSSRMGGPVAAILPKVAATIEGRTSSKSRIDLSTAENWLIRQELISLYKEAIDQQLSKQILSYPDGFGGEPALLEALAGFFNEHFKPLTAITPDDIVVTPGASLCLDALLFSLCDVGDSVMVVAPYWNGFDLHFALRPNVTIIPIHGQPPGVPFGDPDSLSHSLLPSLELAYSKCPSPSRIKALVLTNPSNPVGRCYPEDTIREAILWCGEKGLHYISDEVYGLSDFSESISSSSSHFDNGKPQAITPFISALSIPLNSPQIAPIPTASQPTTPGRTQTLKLPQVTTIWSTSKDLCSSGLRLGVLISRRHTEAPLTPTSTPCTPSTTQGRPPSFLRTAIALLTTPHLPTLSMFLTRYLLTSPRLDKLLALNRARLRHNHDILACALRTWEVPFVPATSTPFLLARLGSACVRGEGGAPSGRECTREEEERAVRKLREEAGVVVAPARAFHLVGEGEAGREENAGWVRIVFAVPEELLREAIARMAGVLGLGVGWDGEGEGMSMNGEVHRGLVE